LLISKVLFFSTNEYNDVLKIILIAGRKVKSNVQVVTWF